MVVRVADEHAVAIQREFRNRREGCQRIVRIAVVAVCRDHIALLVKHNHCLGADAVEVVLLVQRQTNQTGHAGDVLVALNQAANRA